MNDDTEALPNPDATTTPLVALEGDVLSPGPMESSTVSADNLVQMRAEGPRVWISATTDREAVTTWIAKFDKPTTRANNQKEIERFLLWCRARNRTLAGLMANDLIDYGMFLRSMETLSEEAKDQWISEKRYPRGDIRWRPFQKPLSKASQRQALIAVRSCLQWLAKARYLDGSPADLLSITKARREKIDRYLPWDALDIVLEAIEALPEKTQDQARVKARNRFLVNLFALTGARLSDVPGCAMSSMRRHPDGLWWWHVHGKGDKEAEIVVPSDLLNALRRYRTSLGLTELPASDEVRPLVESLRTPAAASTQEIVPVPLDARMRCPDAASEAALYVVLKHLLKIASDLAKDRDPDLSKRLKKASPHWLRHTTLTKQADEKMDLRWIQANARHDDINTTMLYLHDDDRARHAETDRVMKLKPQ